MADDDASSSTSTTDGQGEIQYDDNDITLFRKIHPSESLSRGRSILDVLYTRSIHGPRGMGGIKNSLIRKPVGVKKGSGDGSGNGNGNGNSRCPSPSSVILRRKAERTAAANANANLNNNANAATATGPSENDSLEEVLETSPANNSNNNNGIIGGEGDVEIDSLSEVLNDNTTAEVTNINNDINGDVNMQENAQVPVPAPEAHAPQNLNLNLHNSLLGEDVGYTYNYRHKMNAYPTNVSNEIINYVEQTSLCNFKADYLSLDGMMNAPGRGTGANTAIGIGSGSGNAQVETIVGRRARDSADAVVGMEERTYPNTSYRRRINGETHNSNHHSHSHGHNNHHNNHETEYAVSTISIAFSPDGRTVASTHGDHTVKISCCNTGTLIRSLEGHPRTPWTVKYHPSKSNIVASGCLGYQVRLWDWNAVKGKDTTTGNNDNTEDEVDDDGINQYNYHERKAVCLKMIRLRNSIISLSFHPTGNVLAIASGHSLHLWVYENDAATKNTNNSSGSGSGSSGTITEGDSTSAQAGDAENNSNNNEGNPQQQQQQQSSTQTVLHQIRYANNLRCVHFPPGGDTIIIGGHNNSPDASHGHSTHNNNSGETCYSLLLLDFDLNVALMSPNEFNYFQSIDPTDRRPKPRVEVLKNYRTFLPRALLYNDGGFDVSRDGRTLCGCAELWLPFGVNSAAELIEKEEKERIAVMEHSFHVSEAVAMSMSGSGSGSGSGSSNLSKSTGILMTICGPPTENVSLPVQQAREHISSPDKENNDEEDYHNDNDNDTASDDDASESMTIDTVSSLNTFQTDGDELNPNSWMMPQLMPHKLLKSHVNSKKRSIVGTMPNNTNTPGTGSNGNGTPIVKRNLQELAQIHPPMYVRSRKIRLKKATSSKVSRNRDTDGDADADVNLNVHAMNTSSEGFEAEMELEEQDTNMEYPDPEVESFGLDIMSPLSSPEVSRKVTNINMALDADLDLTLDLDADADADYTESESENVRERETIRANASTSTSTSIDSITIPKKQSSNNGSGSRPTSNAIDITTIASNQSNARNHRKGRLSRSAKKNANTNTDANITMNSNSSFMDSDRKNDIPRILPNHGTSIATDHEYDTRSIHREKPMSQSFDGGGGMDRDRDRDSGYNTGTDVSIKDLRRRRLQKSFKNDSKSVNVKDNKVPPVRVGPKSMEMGDEMQQMGEMNLNRALMQEDLEEDHDHTNDSVTGLLISTTTPQKKHGHGHGRNSSMRSNPFDESLQLPIHVSVGDASTINTSPGHHGHDSSDEKLENDLHDYVDQRDRDFLLEDEEEFKNLDAQQKQNQTQTRAVGLVPRSLTCIPCSSAEPQDDDKSLRSLRSMRSLNTLKTCFTTMPTSREEMKRTIDRKKNRVFLLHHALTCTHPHPTSVEEVEGKTYTPCPEVKHCHALSVLVRHVQTCSFSVSDSASSSNLNGNGNNPVMCDVPGCASYKKVWNHYRRCVLRTFTKPNNQRCKICGDVWRKYATEESFDSGNLETVGVGGAISGPGADLTLTDANTSRRTRMMMGRQ